MKYGPIICDPNSEEAKKLVGKTVIASNFYKVITDASILHTAKLVEIRNDGSLPFKVDVHGNEYDYTFIREVIEEEKPTYRPYKDTEEMVDDYRKRFCSHTTIPQFAMPLIWIENRNVRYRFLVSTFGHDSVHVEGSEIYSWLSMKSLFRYMNYLDGSPVGKEVRS